jgi:hypothetical protein
MTKLKLMALLAAACTPDVKTGSAPAAEAADKGACALTVAFGSYAMGIDRSAYQRVRALLRDKGVRRVTEQGYGREGEVTLCVEAAPAEAQRLFEAVRKVLPAKPLGPIAVATAAGSKAFAPDRPSP